MPETKRQLKVFLCHASADKPKARELYRTLKRRGVQPWFDAVDLIPGQNWEIEIPKALLSSDAIIICLSSNSVDKEGYVQKEIKFVLDKAMEMPEGRIFLIPARLEECDLPYSLKQYQYVNLFEKDGYLKLMKALKLRASQLERATVELPKTEEAVQKTEKPIEEKKPPAKLSKSSSSGVDVGGDVSGSGNVINIGQQEAPASGNSEVKKMQPKKTKPPRKPNTAIVVALIGLVGTIIAALIGSPIIEKWFSTVPVSQETATPTMTLTLRPPASSQTFNPIPSLVSTEIVAITSTALPTEITDDNGVQMVLVPAGEFTMGSDDLNFTNENPAHAVYMDAYYIDQTEVTNILYKACVDAGSCAPPKNTGSNTHTSYYGNSEFNDFPVIYVDWNQAKMYCKWRGASLPTEGQWEKAARGQDEYINNLWNERCSIANFLDCNGDTTSVGSYGGGISTYGAYDMLGNLWEWTADWYSETYYQNSPSSNPLGSNSGRYRVMRGGSWSFNAYYHVYSSTFRGSNTPDYIANNVGFRCARDANP